MGNFREPKCDIRSGYDLVFFPLVKYKEINKQGDFVKFIEIDIQKWIRYMYIPNSNLEDNKFGPFRVLLQNPFYISYEIIEKNLNYCWVTHLVEKARRVFVGKITNLFTRTPVDELAFIEFNQIENYFKKKWVKARKQKSDEPYDKSAYDIIDKIIEFYFLLKHENEHSKFQRFKIIDLNLLEEFINLIKKSWIFVEENPFISFYKQLKEENTINCFSRFYNFIDRAIYSEDSVFKTFEEHFNLINKFEDEEEEEFLNYKEKNVKEDFQRFSKDILCAKLQSFINEKENYLTYCKPFEKLRFFLTEIGILEEEIISDKLL